MGAHSFSLLHFAFSTLPFDLFFLHCHMPEPELTPHQDEVSREGVTGVMYCAVNASENSYRL